MCKIRKKNTKVNYGCVVLKSVTCYGHDQSYEIHPFKVFIFRDIINWLNISLRIKVVHERSFSTKF